MGDGDEYVRVDNYHYNGEDHDDGGKRRRARGIDDHDDVDGHDLWQVARQKGHDEDCVDNNHEDGGERRRAKSIDDDGDDDGRELWPVTRQNKNAKGKD